jgi:hypothetical protein
MAFKCVNLVPGVGEIELMVGTKGNGTTYTMGDLVYRDTGTGAVIPCVATAGETSNVEGIVAKTSTPASASAVIRIVPVVSGQYVIADCTNNTHDNQLNINHLLTDCATVNNTSSHSSDVNAIFVALRRVGAETNKKLFGYIAKVGQVGT